MAKGLIGGMTDYNHQSFDDILVDLYDERKRTISFRDKIVKNIDILKANSYWNNVPFNFKSQVEYAVKHYNTAITEEIHKDLKNEVKEHHIKRLRKISTVSREINVSIGRIWHQEYDNDDYDNSNFRIVERIYCDTRDMAVNLLDISNVAERLNDYIGKSKFNMKKNNPWLSGSFYLFLVVIVIATLGVLAQSVHWALLPIIIIGGILLIGLIGIFQLKNDDKITDKSFVSLVKETYKRLPLISKKNE